MTTEIYGTQPSEAKHRQFQLALAIGSIVLVGVLVGIINFTSVLGYVYFLLLGMTLYRWLAGSDVIEALLLYALYSFLAIALYTYQNIAFPDYIGFSGNTDDALYYYHTADWLPHNFRLAFVPYGTVREYEQIMRFLTWFPVRHPFDILFFNVIPLVLLPRLVYRLALQITNAPNIGARAYVLTMLCPFLLANSLVLVRDGWTAMAFTGAVLFFLRADYVKMGALLVYLFFIRIGSAAILVLVLAQYVFLTFLRQRKFGRKLLYVAGIVLVVSIATMALAPRLSEQLVAYLEGKDILVNGELGILSTEFASERGIRAAAETNNNTDSIMVRVFEQPFLIRLPIGFAYFFMSPFYTPNQVTKADRFAPRLVLTNILFPILFIFYFGHFIRATWSAWRYKDIAMQITVLAYMAALLAISQGSIQIRHKVMLMPLFYVIVAYGSYQDSGTGRKLGNLGSISLFLIQLGRLLMRMV